MSEESESDLDYIGHTRSGKRYRVDYSSSFFEDSSRNQTENPRKRPAEDIPYYPYTPQKPSGT